MTPNRFNDVVKDTIEVIKQLEKSKGNDYATIGDRLANFKENKDIGVSSITTCLVHIQKHYGTVRRYVNGGNDMTQPIEKRINDIIMYMILLKGIIIEQQELAIRERSNHK